MTTSAATNTNPEANSSSSPEKNGAQKPEGGAVAALVEEATMSRTDASPNQHSSFEPKLQQMQHEPTSMSVALLVYWVFPVLCIAVFGRYGVDTSVGTIPIDPIRHRTTPSTSAAAAARAAQRRQQQQHEGVNAPTAIPTAPSPVIAGLDTSNWPTAYKSTVSEISRRRKRWIHGPPKQPTQQQQHSREAASKPPPRQEQQRTTTTITEKKKITPPATTQTRGASTDRQRIEWQDTIRTLRIDHDQDPINIFKCIQYADAMRFFSLRYHDGGTYEIESIRMYDTCVALVVDARHRAMAAGLATNVNKAAAALATTATTTSSSLYSLSMNGDDDDEYNADAAFSNDLLQVADEATLDYTEKSLDGMLCAVYTAQGKNYFLANLFARAAEAYSHCLDEIEPNYLDARNNRASALIILGDYEQAAADLTLVIQRDRHRIFTDAFMGLARILETKDEAVVGGWDNVVRLLEGELIPQFQVQWSSVASVSTSLLSLEQQQVKQVFGTALRRFHHVLFTYHDRKTKNYPEAWKHLIKSHSYKLSVLTPWVGGSEMVKLNQIQQVFKPGFWPPEVGSDLQTPIFVVGFPRSGSTLLESVLDAHPQIVGTGENSVFNGRLDDIRNQIVRVSMTGQRDQIGPLTRTLAQEVVDEMQRLWEMRVQKTKREEKHSISNVSSTSEQQDEEEVDEEKPSRFVDKMLTNYFNIGFIHMLYPKALILHVVREPLDTIFSAYKHEFPAGGLEYTSDMHALSELYLSYRQVMEHWDAVLPGRVTHIRYEDLVHDMPGMARAVIAATGLKWDDAVLNKRQDYHVNTMSATQIRKKVYKDSVKSWMRYQNELKDLIQLIGDRVDCDIQTTLPNYSRAPPAV